MNLRRLVPISVLFMLVLVIGCGGGGGGSSTGTATATTGGTATAGGTNSTASNAGTTGNPVTAAPKITVSWPLRTRNLNAPSSALSVTVSFTQGTSTAQFTQNRSSNLAAHIETYTSVQTLPVGNANLNANFYSDVNGSGTLVGTAGMAVLVNLDGSVTSRDGTPLPPIQFNAVVKSVAVGANQSLNIGQTVQLSASAFDNVGGVVAISPGSLTWTVTQGSNAITVTGDGMATGIAAGTPTLQVSADGVTSPLQNVTVVNPTQYATPTVSIEWPLRTRTVGSPSSALSVHVNISGAPGAVDIFGDRSSSLAAHVDTYSAATQIPVGTYTLSATFYSLTGQQGIVTGTASAQVLVNQDGLLTKPDGTLLGTIQFSATVATVQINTPPPVDVGHTATLTASALDSKGNPVVISAGSYLWEIVSGGNHMLLTKDGQATGVSGGTTTVKATADGVVSPLLTINVTNDSAFGDPSVGVQWPQRSRDLGGPSSAQSVHIILSGTQTNVDIFGDRSANLVAHTDIYTATSAVPVGEYTLTSTFFANTGETGIIVGTAAAPVKVNSDGSLTNQDGTALGTINFTGTIKNVKISSTIDLIAGHKTQLIATATDGNGQPVVVTPGSFVWTGSILNPPVWIVTPDGFVTANPTAFYPGPFGVVVTIDGVSDYELINVLKSPPPATFTWTQAYGPRSQVYDAAHGVIRLYAWPTLTSPAGLYSFDPKTATFGQRIDLQDPPRQMAVNAAYSLGVIAGAHYYLYDLSTVQVLTSGDYTGTAQRPWEFTPAQAIPGTTGWALTVQDSANTARPFFTFPLIAGATDTGLGSDVVISDDRSTMFGFTSDATSNALNIATYSGGTITIQKTLQNIFTSNFTHLHYSNGYVLADTGQEIDPVSGKQVGLFQGWGQSQYFATEPNSDRIYCLTFSPNQLIVYSRTSPIPINIIPLPDATPPDLPQSAPNTEPDTLIWVGPGSVAYRASVPGMQPKPGIMVVSGLP